MHVLEQGFPSHYGDILKTKPTRCTNFSNLFWNRTLYVLDRFSVYHQESSTVWHIPITVYTVLDSWWWTENLPKTCRVPFQNKFEKLLHLVGFIIRIYHDARSSECHIEYRDYVMGWKTQKSGVRMWQWSQIFLSPQILGPRPTNLTL